MKMKQQASDFRVEEIPSIGWSEEKNPHAVYLMEKEEVDTFDAVRKIAHKLRLPQAEIGFAGLKDKHAHSLQYISLPAHCNIETMKMQGVIIKRVGYRPNKIQIGDLEGNKFTITIRDLNYQEATRLPDILDNISDIGVPNYYDSQRFGSVIDNVFIAKLLIQQNPGAAVKQFLTAFQKSEPIQIKEEKRLIASHWNNLTSLRLTDPVLSGIIQEYTSSKDWAKAYQHIPAHLREMHANAYQSYLWNETLRELLKATISSKDLFSVQYAAGAHLFYTTLLTKDKQAIPPELYTPSENAVYSGVELASFKKVMEREAINQADLARLAETGHFLKARPRETIIIPKDTTASKPQPDDLNSSPRDERWKITITFTLPKGSYATIITKRIFHR